MEDFGQSLAFTLAEEGGFVDDARDPGAATNMGITLATLRGWTGDSALGADDIRALTEDVAASIYGANYWNQLRCDSLPAGLDLMVFDFSVNAGCATSARLLQGALGLAADQIDGCIGPMTLARARAADCATVLQALLAAQQARYRSLSEFGVFGHGWLGRTQRRFTAASSMMQVTGALS